MSSLEARYGVRNPYDVARELGLQIVLPAPNELFLDLDDNASKQVYQEMLVVLQENISGVSTRESVSPGGNTHAVVTIPNQIANPALRIALQACLGSDRKHELLSALTVLLELPHPPTVFFEIPQPCSCVATTE